MKTPDYQITKDINIGGLGSEKILEAWSFVKPIDYYYVPKHVIDAPENTWHIRSRDVFCYTRYGIVSIPQNIIIRV